VTGPSNICGVFIAVIGEDSSVIFQGVRLFTFGKKDRKSSEGTAACRRKKKHRRFGKSELEVEKEALLKHLFGGLFF
jgi:hypothetical protein